MDECRKLLDRMNNDNNSGKLLYMVYTGKKKIR